MRPLMICLHAIEANVKVIDHAIHDMPFNIQHEVDTKLLALIRTKQPIELQIDYIRQRFEQLLKLEPAFIFVTCTNFIVLLDKTEIQTHVPILKIDEILFEQMKDLNAPMKLLFSNEETIGGTLERLRQYSKHELDIEVVHIPDVFEWYLAGDTLGHDQKVLSTLLELGTFETVLVVPQLSMANIAEIYSKLSGNPVLSPLTALKSYMNQLL